MRSIILLSFLCPCLITMTVALDHMKRTNRLRFHEPEQNNQTLIEKWMAFEKSTKNMANSVIKMALPRLMDSQSTVNISKECMKNTMYLISGIKNIKPWAMKFLDSSAKIINGLLYGSFSNYGVYDECVQTEVKSTRLRDKGKLLFRGQYCIIELSPPMPANVSNYRLDDVVPELKNFSERDTIVGEFAKYAHIVHFLRLRLGVCTPSGCSLEDVDELSKLLGNGLSLNAAVATCEVKEEIRMTPFNIAVITAFMIPGALMLIGTSIDIHAYYKKMIYKSKLIRCLVAFSFFTNYRKFTNTKTASDNLSCLNGVRFFCMTWITLAHTYLLNNFQNVHGLIKATDYTKDFAFQAVVNATMAVDTFFFIGGLLVCYLTIKQVRIHGHKFSVGLYIFHRLWRLLPVYVFVILSMFVGNWVGSGPMWYETTHYFRTACESNWWTNLIFINNFYNADHMCLPHSWYMACDFQLYIASLIVLLPIIRWPRVGIFIGVLGIMASVLYCGLATYINDYPPTMLFSNSYADKLLNFTTQFYDLPYVHAGPYFIGLIAGYILATRPNLKIPRSIQIVGWPLAFIFNFCVLYGSWEWNNGKKPALFETIMYASFLREAWALGVGWMIVCCATGHGGIINYILSLKVFVPLGRLTYVAYLVHPLVQMIMAGNLRIQIQGDHYYQVWMFFGHLCVTYGLGFALSMLVEAPFISLEKVLLSREEKSTEKNSITKQDSILKGTLKNEKNGDIAAIVPKIDEESGGIDNKCVVYKL